MIPYTLDGKTLVKVRVNFSKETRNIDKYIMERNGLYGQNMKGRIETIFSSRNLDNNCDTIARQLYPYSEQVISLLDASEYHHAIDLFLEILDSLTRHFVEDEHYTYFDDMYSPDYPCQYMLENILKKVSEGLLPKEELEYLNEGMMKLEQAESYTDYGYPYALSLWKSFMRKK